MGPHPDDIKYAVVYTFSKVDGVTSMQSHLDSLVDGTFGNQDQACKNNLMCWINDGTNTQTFTAPGFEDYYITDPPSWVRDIVGDDLLNVSAAAIRALIKHDNWQPVHVPGGGI